MSSPRMSWEDEQRGKRRFSERGMLPLESSHDWTWMHARIVQEGYTPTFDLLCEGLEHLAWLRQQNKARLKRAVWCLVNEVSLSAEADVPGMYVCEEQDAHLRALIFDRFHQYWAEHKQDPDAYDAMEFVCLYDLDDKPMACEAWGKLLWCFPESVK